MNRMKKIVPIPKLAILALAAFALSAGANRVMADPTTPPRGAPDDARIVQRVLDLNQAEERTAEAIKGRLSSIAAWQLAERMTVDHAALDRKFEDLASASQPTSGPPDSAAASLAKLSGRDLDNAYVRSEVKSHEEMLAALDRELIPNAKSEELRHRLVELRAEVVAHLQTAQAVQQAEWRADTYAQERAEIMKEVGVIESSGP